MITKRINFLVTVVMVISIAYVFGGQFAGQNHVNTPEKSQLKVAGQNLSKAGEQGQQETDSDKWAKLEGFHENSDDDPVFQILALAQKSIDMEIYTMSDPDVQAMIRKAINRKPKPIRVRIIKEPNPVGESCNSFKPISLKDTKECQDHKNLVEEIRLLLEENLFLLTRKNFVKDLLKQGVDREIVFSMAN